ncbi:MAG: hypothetical protein WC117_08310 [Sphaerochaetaceae bacterium]|nr:hypothetical protein [Sphaerochaetaceae bacterium]
MNKLPEWILKFKAKGVHVKKTKKGYQLYIGGIRNTCQRFYDEYLGIVTDALKPPVRGA